MDSVEDRRRSWSLQHQFLASGSALWSGSNWREIRRTRWLALLASLVALAASIALDYERRGTNLNVFYEDAPKLLGIVGWATYFVFTTVDITLSAVRTREPVAPA